MSGEELGHVEAILKAAKDIMQRDARIRMMVDSSVVEARGQLGRYIDPEHADEEAFRLAQNACALLAARIFTEDAELATLRQERDRYKELAEEALLVSPIRPLIRQATEQQAKTDATPYP